MKSPGRSQEARPSFFRPRTLPEGTWPALPAAAASQDWAAYLELDRTQWLSRREIEQLQLAQLRTLVLTTLSESPLVWRSASAGLAAFTNFRSSSRPQTDSSFALCQVANGRTIIPYADAWLAASVVS